jgi:TatD DNase family protein
MTPRSPPPRGGVRYFDAHNHLQDRWLDSAREKIYEQLIALPLEGAVVNGTSAEDWPRVAELAEQFTWVRPSFGLHPWSVGNRAGDWFENLIRHLDQNPGAGLGEIGLDRWMLKGAREDDSRLAGLRRASMDEQVPVFARQLALATERNLPVTIHCLDAWDALQTVLTQSILPARGFLMHAYSGSIETSKWLVDRGAFFSFNGSFLGERHLRVQSVFQALPLKRLLVETDAPAMALPLPWRTHKLPPAPGSNVINHPGNIEAAYVGLAALRGISLLDLSTQVAHTFHSFFDHEV